MLSWKRIFPLLTSLCLFSALTGCGRFSELFGRKQGFTQVRIGGTQALKGSLHSLTSLTGGMIVYALREDGARMAVSAASDTSPISATLPNGKYKFYAVGWVSNNLTGSVSSTHKPRCGISETFDLQGTPVGTSIDIPLSMSAADCITASNGFASSAALSSGTFAPLAVTFCQTTNNIGSATAAGGCVAGMGPYIGSFEVKMITYGFTAPSATPPAGGDGIVSTCFVGPNATGAGVSTTAMIPTGDTSFPNSPIAVELTIYTQTEDCTGTATRYVFPHGLANGISGETTALLGDGAGSLNLYLNSNTQFTFNFTSGQAASNVIGQGDFITGSYSGSPSATSMSMPAGVDVASDGSLRIASQNNNRILGFNSIPTSDGASATFALGQTSLALETQGTSASQLTLPSGVSSFGGKVAIADNAGNRVLIHNSLASTTGAAADVVVGAAGFTSGSGACLGNTFTPQNVTLRAGKMLVSDATHNRVLIYNSVPSSNGAAADLVLGQPDFTTCTSGTSSTTLNNPRDAWTDGVRVAVVDGNNNRILIWNTFPTTNGQAADLVLGQADFTSSSGSSGPTGMSNPMAIWSNGNQLMLADRGIFRVLIWNSFPTTMRQAADVVLGQSSFFSGSPSTTATGLNEPSGISAFKNKVVVGDVFNNRAVVFTSN